MSERRTARKHRSSSLVYREPEESLEQLSDQSALPNLNSDWMNAKGAWLIHIVIIILLRIFSGAVPGVSPELSWTLTNFVYMFGSYIMFHWVKGVPFEFNSGAYDRLNMWEQMDSGEQHTPNKKFLVMVPVVLFLVSTHYTNYNLFFFTINFCATLAVVIPKMPFMRLRDAWTLVVDMRGHHYGDYCDVYLTHDSMSVRKAHNSGRNHLRNVVEYYSQISHEKAQSVIDSITNSYAAEGQGAMNPMLGAHPPGAGMPGVGGAPGFPPPFGFPGMPNARPGVMPPPPFGMNMPTSGPGGLPPLPSARGMNAPPFPFPQPSPSSASPSTSTGPTIPPPNFPAGMPFPPPGAGIGNFPQFPGAPGGFPPSGSSQQGPPGGYSLPPPPPGMRDGSGSEKRR
ncbi:MAG: hypothetical protein M1834_001275 [Cirrosporium novae-zelandiae]|nr:MAG: hypothetical protein M1834_001275 [Cirrosporium novae-zelandiae]